MLELHSVVPKHSKTNLISPFSFTITLDSRLTDAECEFSIIYGGSPNTDFYDQTLIRTLIGPIPEGRVQFELECEAVQIEKLSYIFGITSLIIIGKYKGREFTRVGYFVKVEYPEIRLELLEDEVIKETMEEMSEGLLDEEEDGEMGSEDIDEDSETSEEDEENVSDESDLNELPKTSVKNVDEMEDRSGISIKDACNKSSQTDFIDDVDNPKTSIDSAQLVDSNALVNILTSPTLKKIKDLEGAFLNTEEEIQNEEVDFVSNETEEREEMDALMAEKTGITIEDGKLLVKDLALNINEITVEFCEPPLVTPFIISWSENSEASEDNEVCIDEEPDNDITQTATESNIDTDPSKKRKID